MSVAAATDRARLRLAAGVAPDDERDLGPRIRRALTVARDVGAPLLPALDAAAAAEDDAARARRAVAVATAQARTVAGGLVLAPPLLVPVIGGMAGADVVAFYMGPVGRVVLAIGLALVATGGLVALALVRRAVRTGPDAELEEAVELVATALGGGAGPAAALRTVASLIDGPPARHAQLLRSIALELDLGLDPGRSAAPAGGDGPTRLRATLGLATEVGAPAAPVLRRLAADLRADETARVLAAAERLPAQLTVPATLLLLPAAVLLIAAPVLDVGLRAVAG